jgi:hypothetical protein
VVWRRASRAQQPDQQGAVAADIAAVLSHGAFATQSGELVESLRRAELRDYHPERLAGFEARATELLEAVRPAAAQRTERRAVTLAPRPSDSGLR